MSDKLQKEFTHQLNNLISKGYPEALGIADTEFIQHIKPLSNKLAEVKDTTIDLEKGILPFVIVITDKKLPPEKMMSLVEREGKQGVEKMYPHQPSQYSTIDSVNLPTGLAYLLIDIDRGKDTLNITPNEALERIKKENHSPLTIDEGIAILIQYPDFLKKNNCFSLLASRIQNPEPNSSKSINKTVPAIWINSKKQPNLGWCWAGNPHTWLGSASCSKRVGL